MLVLDRDRRICRVTPNCPELANIADHIIPVYPGMPDALFFSPANLRAACRIHNLARTAERLEAKADPSSSVVTKDYSA